MAETTINIRTPETEKGAAIFSLRSVRGLAREEFATKAWGEERPRWATLPREWPLIWALSSGTTDVAGVQGASLAEGPVSELGTFEDNETQVKQLISRSRVLPVSYKDSLARRLFELFEDSKEEDPDGMGISLGSLRSFYSFLQSNPNLRKPALSLTPDCEIYASWRSGSDRVFSIHFLASGLARFAILSPACGHAGQQVRLSGIATLDNFLEKVAPWGVLAWAGNGRR
jgi:hypothetical protein